MKKLLSLAAVFAVVVVGCGGGSSAVAATVGDTEITVGDVEVLMDLDGATVTRDQFAQFLSFAIQWEVVVAAAEADFGITVSDEEVAAQADLLYEEVAIPGVSRDEFLSERGVTEEFLQKIALQGLLIDERISELFISEMPPPTSDEIDAARDTALAALTTACVSHILVDTADEATEVLDRLEAGEEFGELAVELSTDPGSGENNGILPCTTLNTYVEPFAQASLVAPVGEVYETPVESQFGFHIILVTDRTDADETDLPSDEALAESILEGAVVLQLDTWALGAVQTADVTVVEEFGTWDATLPGVVPPAS
jgi:parvulin-like peptidyl-prolyl isomerase